MFRVFILASFLITGWCPLAKAECPASPVGLVVERTDAGGRRFYSTDKTEALAASDESRSLAATEARISARSALAKSKDVPKRADGRLRGVTELNVCSVGSFVYVTLLVDEISVRRALSLENAISNSLQTLPVPTSRQNAEPASGTKDIFNRLMESPP